MKVDVVLEQAGNNWSTYAPDLDDIIVATGATREETVSGFRDALRGTADLKREEGKIFLRSRNSKFGKLLPSKFILRVEGYCTVSQADWGEFKGRVVKKRADAKAIDRVEI